ncbi:MAG: glycosyltransferase [Tepidisphaeraceae bacterium]|jgi:glycosyltransferase involved in cell wall biosynthesis
MKPLRIAVALPGIHRVNRGAETAFEELARRLAAMGHDLTVFGSGRPRPDQPYRYVRIPCTRREAFEHWPKFPPLRTPYAWEELSFARTLAHQYRPREFDLSLACSYPFTNWILRRKFGHRRPKHVFVTQNGDWMLQAHNAEYAFFNCDGLVCTNPLYFARHRGRFPSAMIPNGVDVNLFRPGRADRAAFGLPADRPVALMVSALASSKRVLQAIDAVGQIPGLFLAIAGDGPLRRRVDREAGRLLAGRYRRFKVPRGKMPALYRCADVLLHASVDEPSANVYLEALATGLPIVAHDWQVTRWTLEDCAILIDATDPAQIVSGLEQGLASRSAEQIAARRQLAQRFTWDLLAQRYAEFFHELMWPIPVISVPRQRTVMSDVGVVAIGRNEGERLNRCLASVMGKVAAVVYVDSGSSDGSPRLAAARGASVVYLDTRQGFTAARARNAGLDRLLQIAPRVSLVQFVDGDCEVQNGWLTTARAYLQSRDDLAVVCGRRRELHAARSLYNRVIDIEWNTPIGAAKSCGGDAMMKTAAVLQVGSFDPSVMAGEEPELCLRLRNAGWRIWRIDAEMTRHDSAIRRFGQWWWRQVRGGYGAVDVYQRFGKTDRLFAAQVRSARLWGLAVPAMILPAAIVGAVIAPLLDAPRPAMALAMAIAVILLWFAQLLRLTAASLRKGRPMDLSLAWAFFTMVSKFAAIYGQWRWLGNRNRGQKTQLIEYKPPVLSKTVISKEVKA